MESAGSLLLEIQEDASQELRAREEACRQIVARKDEWSCQYRNALSTAVNREHPGVNANFAQCFAEMRGLVQEMAQKKPCP